MTLPAARFRLALCLFLPFLAGCMEAGAGGGIASAPAVGGDGPVFVTDERGCLYEVINGQRFPIVYESGRQQCRS